MEDENENYGFSDEEIDDTKHNKMVESILNLNKIQNLKKPSRTEPTLHISEFNLVKSVTGNKGSVHLNELTKVLKGRKKQNIAKKLQSTSTKSKTLPTPLEKPQADRIRRSVNYERSRLELDRWEALVTSNRAASHLTFPLDSIEKLKIEDKIAERYPSTWRIKSDLQRQLEKIVPKVEEYHINPEQKEQFPLSLEEIAERRKEAAKLRAHQSYKEAKARRQNKIKSKKYHRILRREKIKTKLKEFEELQKTNPEEALKKLEDIEKARAEERFSLRHKGTGQWAKSKQVRAKYDKESRQVLAQQLAISRELTQKIKSVDSDSEDEGIESGDNTGLSNIDKNNPWVSKVNPEKEITDFVKSYRQYWNDHNKNLQANTDNETIEQANIIDKEKTIGDVNETEKVSEKVDPLIEKSVKKRTKKNSDKQSKKASKVKENKHQYVIINTDHNKNAQGNTTDNETNEHAQIIDTEKTIGDVYETDKVSEKVDPLIKKSGKNKTKKISDKQRKRANKVKENNKHQSNNSVSTSAEWDVSLLDKHGENNLEDMFDELEKKLGNKMKQKYITIKETKSSNGKKTKKRIHTKKKRIDLTLPSKSKKHVIDEPLIEKTQNRTNNEDVDPGDSSELNALQAILESVEPRNQENRKQMPDIDPNKFMEIKTTTLNNMKPDVLVTDDNEENGNQRNIILEAFEDDDIAEDFAKEKTDEVEKDTPKDIDLNLPGWGSWGGANINPSKRKRKRFILKMPKKMPRRDDNKGSLIINEKALSKIKPLMVSEVPFPFKTVKDYEASIRAPIGNTFVTETAFKKLIEPAVTTKMGSIIEPISKSILVGKPKMFH